MLAVHVVKDNKRLGVCSLLLHVNVASHNHILRSGVGDPRAGHSQKCRGKMLKKEAVSKGYEKEKEKKTQRQA